MSNGRITLLFFFISCYFFISTKSANDVIDFTGINQTDAEACQDESCRNISKEQNITEAEDQLTNTVSKTGGSTIRVPKEKNNYLEIANLCPVDAKCHELPAKCLVCKFNYTCVYGELLNVTCKAIPKCEGPNTFNKVMRCQYCYQTASEDHSCNLTGYCNTASNPVQKYRSNCTANSDVLCLGQRKFIKNIRCNWTSGYKWSTTLLLSITLGGFGADRFYLGHWQEGIGKLFSFGGAGVWTLVDVILVAVGYLKPADGSVYI